ncbi:MAG: hypothetical protein WA996_15980 [Candidatus Promineifilaceae bacterium]
MTGLLSVLALMSGLFGLVLPYITTRILAITSDEFGAQASEPANVNPG